MSTRGLRRTAWRCDPPDTTSGSPEYRNQRRVRVQTTERVPSLLLLVSLNSSSSTEKFVRFNGHPRGSAPLLTESQVSKWDHRGALGPSDCEFRSTGAKIVGMWSQRGGKWVGGVSYAHQHRFSGAARHCGCCLCWDRC